VSDAFPRPLRVLSIADTAVSRAAGRLRYHPFAHDGSLDVTLVVPSRWHQFGRWLTADPADDPGAASSRCRLGSLAPAQPAGTSTPTAASPARCARAGAAAARYGALLREVWEQKQSSGPQGAS